MTPADPYNDEVRRCFENPVHAGDLEASYARVLRSGAAAPGEGTRLELTAGICLLYTSDAADDLYTV